ncbi:tyrosine-protein phosphatase [Erwinia sp. MYb375]|uniref:tyrosine-protein phosphatase n=1 Tax=Erwinia sp. MYb375 TaxID=2745272 RepID=UPI0030AA534F
MDFRGINEANVAFPFSRKIINIPMTTVGELYRRATDPAVSDLVEFYIEIIDAHRGDFSQLLQIVTSSPSVGFGCFFGKDRTGMASFLLCKKFNVSLDDIILDYRRSEYELKKSVDLFSAHWLKRGSSREHYLQRLCCPAAAIEQVDHYLTQQYGGIDHYLEVPLIKGR